MQTVVHLRLIHIPLHLYDRSSFQSDAYLAVDKCFRRTIALPYIGHGWLKNCSWKELWKKYNILVCSRSYYNLIMQRNAQQLLFADYRFRICEHDIKYQDVNFVQSQIPNSSFRFYLLHTSFVFPIKWERHATK